MTTLEQKHRFAAECKPRQRQHKTENRKQKTREREKQEPNEEEAQQRSKTAFWLGMLWLAADRMGTQLSSAQQEQQTHTQKKKKSCLVWFGRLAWLGAKNG